MGYRATHCPVDDPTEEDAMCYPVSCSVCGKTTWDGCGQHVDEVKAAVPAEKWCGGEHPAPVR